MGQIGLRSKYEWRDRERKGGLGMEVEDGITAREPDNLLGCQRGSAAVLLPTSIFRGGAVVVRRVVRTHDGAH